MTFKARRPLAEKPPQAAAPQFGMDPAAVIGIGTSVVGIVSCFGTAVSLMIKQNAWEKALSAIKEEYFKVERKEREGFLKTLPERTHGFEKNPSLVWWHKYQTRCEQSRQADEAHEELRTQTKVMWTYTTMQGLLDFFKETKRETLEHPDAFLHPKVVYSWASYMEAMHLVTKAGNNRALTPEQKQDWYRVLDQKWEKTPILKRPALADSFENISTQITELIRNHSRNKSMVEVQREYAGMLRELQEDPQLFRTVRALLDEHEDVEFDELPDDPSDLDPTFDHDELQRREEARAIRRFRTQLETLSPEDFMDRPADGSGKNPE